jgi:Omp85 superfamily domain
MPGRLRQVAFSVVFVMPLVTAPVPAQQLPGHDSSFAAGPQFRAGGIGRIFTGARYRELWTTPISAPSLKLSELHGGLVPTGADSGFNAGILYLRAPDGRSYAFRRIDRDPTAGLPAYIRTQLTASTLEDLTAAKHPGAPLVVQALAPAAGITMTAVRLVRLADDPALGPWRESFGGRLGYLGDAPRELSVQVRTTATLLGELDQPRSAPVDTAAYLRDRLFDLFLGQWDLATVEWRWAFDRATGSWAPLPRDRDAAFANYDGVIAGLASGTVPAFVSFGGRYAKQLGLMPYQRSVDRRLLAGVTREHWDSAANAMQAELTDSVINAAVGRLPPEYAARSGPKLAARLRLRRDSLPEAAHRLYLMLSSEVEVYASTGADHATAIRSGKSLSLELSTGFHRRVELSETAEVRLFLLGGADTLDVRGPEQRAPRLLVTAPSSLVVTGDSNRRRRLEIVEAGRSELPDTKRSDTVRAYPTSGSTYTPLSWFELNTDVGLLFGAGISYTSYGLGYGAWRSRQHVRAAYATTPEEVAIEYVGEFRRRHSRTSFSVDARRSGIDVLRFFGFGNESARTRDLDYYRLRHRYVAVIPAVHVGTGPRTTVSVSAIIKHVRTDTTGDNLIGDSAPYGVPDFGQVGLSLALSHDSRDRPTFTRSGTDLRVGVTWHPRVWDAEESFGNASASAAGYYTPAWFDNLTLALRLSGQLAFGRYPYYEAVYLGGAKSLRGYEPQRYAGDAGLLANSEARLDVARLPVGVQLDFGVVGIADLGRVWLEGEQSDIWHAGTGGGVWFALADRSFGIVFSFVQSVDDNTALFETGFAF